MEIAEEITELKAKVLVSSAKPDVLPCFSELERMEISASTGCSSTHCMNLSLHLVSPSVPASSYSISYLCVSFPRCHFFTIHWMSKPHRPLRIGGMVTTRKTHLAPSSTWQCMKGLVLPCSRCMLPKLVCKCLYEFQRLGEEEPFLFLDSSSPS